MIYIWLAEGAYVAHGRKKENQRETVIRRRIDTNKDAKMQRTKRGTCDGGDSPKESSEYADGDMTGREKILIYYTRDFPN